LIETYFTAPRVLDRMRSGPMAAYLGPMAAELQSQDYTRKSIRRQIRNADSFGWWLTEQNLTAGEITDDLVGRYIGGLHHSVRAGYSTGYRPHNGRGLPRLLDLLRGSGVLPAVALAQQGPDPLQEFDRYLDRVRGAARATRIGYLGEVRGFVKHVFGDSDPNWTEVRAEHVASYITLRAAKLPITRRRGPITPVRAFLRYMTGEGLLSGHLEYAIPPIREWKHAALPAALSADELGKVIALPCERTVKSFRDRAIIMLLARLGLRASEVLRLHLEDIEWRQAKFLVRAGKNHRERVLPLPEDVGQALTAYLQDGRPSADRRAIFLNLCYPYRPLGSSQTIWKIATEALRQAGVSTTNPGAHVFRHYAGFRTIPGEASSGCRSACQCWGPAHSVVPVPGIVLITGL
jgi:integrase/recombinase XerD